MTFANWITLLRLALIPVFVLFAIYYSRSLAEEQPDFGLRWISIGAFTLAAVSDALDGWIARRFNQHSALGKVLDPLADKGLLLAGVLTLSLSPWDFQLPVWFAVLVISRDVLIVTGFVVLSYLVGRNNVHVSPTFLGKACTALQMSSVVAVLIGPGVLPDFVLYTLIAFASLLTFLSGVDYVRAGVHLLKTHGH